MATSEASDGTSVGATSTVGGISIVGAGVGVSVGIGVGVGAGASTLNTRTIGLCVLPASSRPRTSRVCSSLSRSAGRYDHVEADSAVNPDVTSIPSSFALIIVTEACKSPEYSPISSAKLTVINGRETVEISRLPGTTTGGLITVSRSNWTAPVGYPSASTATPPRAMFSAASNPAASIFLTPSPAAAPVNVVPSTWMVHEFVPTG